MTIKKNDLVFNNGAELTLVENKSLDRKLGIIVGNPYYNQGAKGIVCDLQTESISVNTVSSICWPKIGEINTKAVEAHDYMISRIDSVIEELQKHKLRLQSDKGAIESGQYDLDEIAQALND